MKNAPTIILVLAVLILSVKLYNKTTQSNLYYCQVIRQALDKQTTEPTPNRLKLENTYFNNNCDVILQGE